MTWKTLSKKIVTKNNFFTLTEERCLKHNGEIAEQYFTVEKPDSVVIIPFTEDKKVILIKQYRHPIRSTKYEVPAGYVEKKDKSLIASAKRELGEETGYETTKMIKLGKAFALSGFITSTTHFFLALNCKKKTNRHLDKDEEIEVKTDTFKNTLARVKKLDIMDLGSAHGILLAKEYLDNHKIV